MRPVTVLFADVRGFTRLAEMLPAERLVSAINHVFDVLAEVVVRYGGEIDKFIGDAVMARFGAPAAHGDDPRRAVLAALDMHVALRKLNRQLRDDIGTELEMRIGINTGVVLAGPIGSRHHRDYTVMGDAVNVASRLEHAAPIGGVLIGEATRAHLGNAFRLRLRRAVRVRGREGPVKSYVVLGQTASTHPGARRVACLGRADEVKAVLTSLAPVSAGSPAVVSLNGPMGIGKTELVHAVRRTREGRRLAWLVVSCPPYGQDLPYATLAALLRQLLTHLERRTGYESLEALLNAEALGDGLDIQLVAAVLRDLLLNSVEGASETTQSLPAQFRKGMLARATKALLRASSVRRGLMVVLDDTQWLDAASAAILGEAITDLRRSALGWLLVHRPEWRAPSPMSIDAQVDLRALSAGSSAQLARSLLGDGAAPDIVQFVVDRAEGNPLYLVELCGALADSGPLQVGQSTLLDAHSQESRHLSDHLRSLILARVDALDDRARRTLHVAAVLGHAFPATLLRRMLGAEGDAAVFTRLESLGFLVRQTQLRGDGAGTLVAWRFRHPLMQETVYASLLSSTRAMLHREAGGALEEMADAEVADRLALLALHFGRSDDRERAVQYLRAAGDRARTLYLNREACSYYDEALARLGIAGQERAVRADVLAAKAAALEVMADDERVFDCLLTAVQLEGRPEMRADLWRRVADVYRRRGAYVHAREALENSAKQLPARPLTVHHARVHVARAMLEMELGKHHEMHRWSMAALGVLADESAPQETAAAYRALGIACAQAGDSRAARDALEKALVVAREARDDLSAATIASNLANVMRFLGFRVEARGLHQQSLDFYERIGAKRGIAMACNNIADLAWETEDWGAARRYWERALLLNEEIGDKRGMLIVLRNLGEAFIGRGEPESAKPLLDRGGQIARELGDEKMARLLTDLLAFTRGPRRPGKRERTKPTRAA